MDNETSGRTRLIVGGVVSLIAGLVILALSQFFLFSEYIVILKGFAAEGKNAAVIMQSYEQPIFSQILGLGELLLIVGAYGFFIKRKWAWILAITGSTIAVIEN
ncbi:MAG: hypothetical protein PHE15_01965 [Dehalococcoidales bacterium]|nr:hypothetical protein [Dehalococcoidales bacterium]